MANRERGELTLATADQTYTLVVTTNACCLLEAESGQTFEEHLERWTKQKRFVAFRWLVWAALQTHHADVAGTVEDVGRLIDAADPQHVMRVMATFFALYSDEARKQLRDGLLDRALVEGRANGRPPSAQTTPAGADSTSTRDGSA